MILWRISNHIELSGLSGERADGRWHTAGRGKRIVYLSEHPAVALVETLVNLRGNAAFFPERFQLLRVSLPDRTKAGQVELPERLEYLSATQSVGDEWLASGKSAILRVPSVPSPESWNYLLNPNHPNAAGVAIECSLHCLRSPIISPQVNLSLL